MHSLYRPVVSVMSWAHPAGWRSPIYLRPGTMPNVTVLDFKSLYPNIMPATWSLSALLSTSARLSAVCVNSC